MTFPSDHARLLGTGGVKGAGRRNGSRFKAKGKSIHFKPPAGTVAALEFRSVAQSVDEAIVISDVRGNIIFWNEGAETIFGYSERQILGKPLSLLLPVQARLLRAGELEKQLFSKASPSDGKTHEWYGIREDGSEFPVELSLITWAFGGKTFFTTIMRNITERKRLQKEILEISAKEQQRIGQDLHDDLCQHLTAISLLAEVLERKLKETASAASVDAAEIAKLVTQAIVQTKSLAKGLLPVELEDQGLMAALHEMAANTEKLPQISCRMQGGKPVLIEDDALAVHLYRIAQEAVANALKHARAKHITLSLTKSEDEITLRIADDGIGMAPQAEQRGGLGLSIMRSRAETINATLQIRSGDHGGTVVDCSFTTSAHRTDARRSTQFPERRRHGNPNRG